MLKLNITLLTVLLSATSWAKIYTNSQIERLVGNVSVADTKEFVREYFIAKDPEAYINKYIGIHKNRIEAIFIENRLYSLLDEISYQSKQPYLQEFVEQMKAYEIKAFKLHEEGRLEVAIYNINAKAKGIENIWLAADSFDYYTNAFAESPIETLVNLKGNIHVFKSPEWLGLKNSISEMAAPNRLAISQYFLKDVKNILGLDKFVSHFSLLTTDKALLEVALVNVDKSNSEYLLRQMPNYFSDIFVAEQLINAVNSNKSKAFAISMMAPYVDTHKNIKQFLLTAIANEKLAKHASFALSKTKNASTLVQLENTYQKSQSIVTRKQILHSLKLNQSIQAKSIFSRLSSESIYLEKGLEKEVQ